MGLLNKFSRMKLPVAVAVISLLSSCSSPELDAHRIETHMKVVREADDMLMFYIITDCSTLQADHHLSNSPDALSKLHRLCVLISEFDRHMSRRAKQNSRTFTVYDIEQNFINEILNIMEVTSIDQLDDLYNLNLNELNASLDFPTEDDMSHELIVYELIKAKIVTRTLFNVF